MVQHQLTVARMALHWTVNHIFTHNSDLPNILFVDFQEDVKSFKLQTTKYSGMKSDSTTLQLLTTINIDGNPHLNLANINLYPDKILNLQGREVVLAIFNYMPYVFWMEVVSKRELKSLAKLKFS
jgi:hypothetical protein